LASREEKFGPKVTQFINDEKYEDGTHLSLGNLPLAEVVQSWLEKTFSIRTQRNFRVILVEDFGDYKVFIQVPNGKSSYDFNVWYANFQNGKLSKVSFPKHDYMFEWYSKIKTIEQNLFDGIERVISKREGPENVIRQFKNEVRQELHKFLATLKWICLQEDANYPPPQNMGSKYTLAAYVLLDYGFEPNEIRRLLRFKNE
jgi:hypothetical protein